MAAFQQNMYESSPEMDLMVWECEVKGAGCAGYFLQDGLEPKAVCWSCREDSVLARMEAVLAELRAEGFDTFKLEHCEEGGEACLCYLLTKPGDKDALFEGCRDKHAAYAPLPYLQEGGVGRVVAGLAQWLTGRGLERPSRFLVERFGRPDGFDFQKRNERCRTCRGEGFWEDTGAACTECRGSGRTKTKTFHLTEDAFGCDGGAG